MLFPICRRLLFSDLLLLAFRILRSCLGFDLNNNTTWDDILSILNIEDYYTIFAIFHPSLSYFARDYDLQQLSLEENGKEMTPQRMQQVIEEAKAKGVKTVFIQNEFTPEQVKTFAQEIEASVVVINPLAYNFIEEIREIAYAISK